MPHPSVSARLQQSCVWEGFAIGMAKFRSRVFKLPKRAASKFGPVRQTHCLAQAHSQPVIATAKPCYDQRSGVLRSDSIRVDEDQEIAMTQSFDGTVAWLLEPDPANPGVRYFALRDLLGQAADCARGCRSPGRGHGQRPRAGDPGRAGPGRLLGGARPRLLSQVHRHRLAGHLPGPTGRRRPRPAGGRRLRLRARPHPLTLRRLQRGRRPGRPDSLPAGQPRRRAHRPGPAGRPAP